MDFKGATQLFTDPDLDGKPVVIYEPSLEDPVVPPDIVTPLRVDAPEPLPYDLCLTDKTSGSSGRVRYAIDDINVHLAVERHHSWVASVLPSRHRFLQIFS